MATDYLQTPRYGRQRAINIENNPNGKSPRKAIVYTKGNCRALEAWEALDYEKLTPLSLEMFKAVANDTVDAFVVAHPEYVSKT